MQGPLLNSELSISARLAAQVALGILSRLPVFSDCTKPTLLTYSSGDPNFQPSLPLF